MRKFYLLCDGMIQRLMLLAVILALTAGAKAQVLQEITLDTEYTIPMFESPRYTFTAPETCRIYMYCSTQDFPHIWKDNTFSDPYNVEVNPYNNPRWSFDVEKGNTYYIGYGLGFTMSETTFYISTKGISAVEVLNIDPNTNSRIAVGYPISIGFNVPVSIEGATLQGGTSPVIDLGINLNGAYASFEVKDILYRWMTAGELKENDDVKLTLTGVCSSTEAEVKGGEGGTMVFTWKSAPQPIALVKASLPGEIKSKWAAGDPDGIAVLEFSGDVALGASASLTNGDLSKGGTYEELPTTVEGNKVIVDMTNVARTPAQDDMYVFTVSNVCDLAGYPAYAPGQGTIGSYTYTIQYDDEPYFEPVSFDFTPANGANIKDATEIFIHVDNLTSSFSYTGAMFFYAEGGVQKSVTVAKADIEENNLGTYMNLFIDIPAELANADAGSNVIFTLLNDDTTIASVTYVYGEAAEPEEFYIGLVSPMDGATLEKIGADESIELMVTGIPANADIEIEGTIVDDNTGDNIKWCYFSPTEAEDYNYSCMMWDDVDLFEGHTYTLTVTANSYPLDEEGFRGAPEEIGTAVFKFYGSGKEFIYSSVELIGIDPDPTATDITSVDQNVVTVKFSGPVSSLRVVEPIGMGAGTIDYEVAKANEDGSEWTFTIPQSTIANATGSIAINMYARDAEGHPLYKSALYDEMTWTGIPDAMQAKDETYYSLMYLCTVGSPDIEVSPENGAKVASLDKFVLSYPQGINCSWATSKDIVLYKDGQEIQRWTTMFFSIWDNPEAAQLSGENVVAWTLTLDEEQTQPGTYTLDIPNCFFALGSEFMQYNSKQQTITVTIGDGEADEFHISLVSPAPGATLEKIGADESIELMVTGIPANADIEIEGTIVDDNTGDNIKWCYFSPVEAEDYNYSCMMWDDVDLLEGHTYTLTVTANSYPLDEEGFRGAPEEIGTAVFKFYGSGKEFIYSSVELIGIDPDPTTTDITSVDQNVVTVKFSGPVSSLRVVEPIGMGAGTIDYEVAKANEDGSEWTFTIPQSTIAKATGSIAINMYAIDAEGHPLYKSALYDEMTWTGIPDAMQAKDETYYSLMYLCTVGSPDIEVSPENGSKLASLDKFVLSYPQGINCSWATSKDIVLYKDGQEIQRWTSMFFSIWDNPEAAQLSGENVVAWTLTLDEVQTQPGTYTLDIPNCFFALGSEFMQYNSKQQTITITIDKLEGINGIAADNDGSDAIYNVAGQKVGNDYKGIVIKNGKKVYNK